MFSNFKRFKKGPHDSSKDYTEDKIADEDFGGDHLKTVDNKTESEKLLIPELELLQAKEDNKLLLIKNEAKTETITPNSDRQMSALADPKSNNLQVPKKRGSVTSGKSITRSVSPGMSENEHTYGVYENQRYYIFVGFTDHLLPGGKLISLLSKK